MKLRFRGPNTNGLIGLDIPDELAVGDLPMVLEESFKVDCERMVLAHGFPPKAIEPEAGTMLVSERFKEGDLIIVREGEATLKRGRTDGKYVPPCDERSVMQRREVPADNSCLFHAVALVAQQDCDGPALRMRCVEVVLAHRDKFNAAYLGQPPDQYAAWLAHPTSWGGAIEIAILSFVLQIEIVVVDVSANRTETFGAGEGLVTRGFVYYTGKHYDALGMMSTVASRTQFLFNARDERPMAAAKSLAQSGSA